MAKQKSPAECAACDAECCRYITVEIDTPTRKIDAEEIRWFLAHENTRVYIDDDDGTWNLQVLTRCRRLDKNNRCTVYENRYQICGDYDPETCDASDAEAMDTTFETTEAFDAYWARKQRRKKKSKKRKKASGKKRQKRKERRKKKGKKKRRGK